MSYFNKSHPTTSRFKRHENFVTDIKLPSCALVQTLRPRQRCEYVRSTDLCGEYEFIFNYIDFFFCDLNTSDTLVLIFGLLLMFVMCAIIFSILGITADGFFCPSLKVMSMKLGLGEHVAGVTLLAFGNSAADMFSSFAGLEGEARLLHTDLFGAAIFIVFVVSGVIVLLVPFVVRPGLFMRDVCFLILGVLFIDYVIKTDDYVTLMEAILVLVIYLFYIVVVIADQFLVKITTRNLEKLRRESEAPHLIPMPSEVTIQMFPSRLMRRSYDDNIRMHAYITTPPPSPSEHISHKRNNFLLSQLWVSLNPLDRKTWLQSGPLKRVLRVLAAPVVFCLKVWIPVVNYDLRLNGWSKLLNCAQIVMLPSTFYLLIIGSFGFSDFLNSMVPLVFSIPLAIFVFCVTRTDSAPRYHALFSILGVLSSVYVIYACAKETISIMEVVGIATSRSNAFLGTTLLAYGNSMGDLIANTALARQGYPMMAFAACFGGPLFNGLVCTGLAYTYKASKDPNMRYAVGDGTMGENCTIFLCIGLVGLLFGATTTNFALRRSIGVFLILMYSMYLLNALLDEWECIHPYGSDHRLDLKAEPSEIK